MSGASLEQPASGITRIIGPTIMLGSGTYFDFEDPEHSRLTIDDFAYGLASASRFSGQCVSRFSGRRVRYNVAQHCVLMSYAIEGDPDCKPGDAYDALMHEGGEPTCGDMNGPLKSLCSDFKAIEKRCERAAHRQFHVPMRDPAFIKRHDLRMLATEKRDLVPAANGHTWSWVRGQERYNFEIRDAWEFDEAAERFIARFHELAPTVFDFLDGAA